MLSSGIGFDSRRVCAANDRFDGAHAHRDSTDACNYRDNFISSGN